MTQFKRVMHDSNRCERSFYLLLCSNISTMLHRPPKMANWESLMLPRESIYLTSYTKCLEEIYVDRWRMQFLDRLRVEDHDRSFAKEGVNVQIYALCNSVLQPNCSVKRLWLPKYSCKNQQFLLRYPKCYASTLAICL